MLTKVVNRETISYVLFGVLTSLLNIGIFHGLILVSVDYKLANIVALVTTKITAYLCNKFFVFKSQTTTGTALAGEIIRYTAVRGSTLLIDYFGLILLVSQFNINKTLAKVCVTFIVVLINYLLGKKWVFLGKNPEPHSPESPLA